METSRNIFFGRQFLSTLALVASLASSFFTPIVVFIVQDAPFDSFLTWLLLACDAIQLLDFWKILCKTNKVDEALQKVRFKGRTLSQDLSSTMVGSKAQSFVAKVLKNGFCVFSAFRFLCLFIVPVAAAGGLKHGKLAWMTSLRMANIFFVRKCVDNVYLDDNHKTILIVVVYCVIYASLLSCIWFYLSCVESADIEYDNSNWLYSRHQCSLQSGTWIAHDNVMVDNSYISRYMRSLHFITQTMFTVGFGDIFPTNTSEFSYGLFLLGNGSLFFAFLISSVTSMISHRDVTTTKFREEVDRVKKYLKAREMPAVLMDAVGNYFDFLFMKQLGMKETRFLRDSLAPRLCSAINAHCGEQLKNVPFFASQKASFIDLCMQRLDYRSYAPGTTVMERHEHFRELLLVRSGRIDIRLNKDKNCCLSLVAGDYIGDYQLIFRVRSDYHGRAAVFTEVMVLTYEAFVEAVRHSSAAQQRAPRSLGCGLAAKDNDEYMWMLSQADSIRNTREKYQSQLARFTSSQESALILQQSNRKIFAMMEDLQVKMRDFIIMPNDARVLVWNIVYCLVLLYYSLATPLRIMGAYSHLHDFSNSLIVDYLFDVIAALELLLRTKYFAYTKIEEDREVVVTDRAEIWSHFTSSWRFCGAVVLVIPIDLLAAFCGYAVLFRLTRLAAALLLSSVIGDILQFLEREHMWCISVDGRSMIVIGLYTLLFIVWTSALWSIVHFGGEHWASSFYWVLTTITTVGFGDITAASTWETCLVISVTVIGPSLFAVNIGGIISYLKHTDASADSVEHKRAVTKHLVEYLVAHCRVPDAQDDAILADAACTASHRIAGDGGRPASLRMQALGQYFSYLDSERCGVQEAFLDQYLPSYFQEEARCAHLLPMLSGTYAFKSLDPAILKSVLRGLSERVYFQKEVVVECNRSANGLYLIRKGAVTLYGSGDVYLERKEAGQLFGESSLLEGDAYMPRARASRDCELWFISKQCLEAALRAVPEENLARLREAVAAQFRSKSSRSSGKKNRMNGIINGNLQQILTLGKSFDGGRAQTLRPDGKFMVAWSAVLVLLSLYSALVLPFRAAFMAHRPIDYGFAGDYLCDAVFLVDILLRACAVSYYDQSDLVVDRASIFRRYVSSPSFVWHVLSLVPTDLLVLAPALVSPAQCAAQTLSLLRLNRLLRLVDVSQHTRLLDNASLRLSRGPGKNAYRLFKLIATVLIIAHVGGCVFFWVGSRAHLMGDSENWLDRLGLGEACSFGLAAGSADGCEGPPSLAMVVNQYTHSLYWAVTLLTTTGYGDIVPVSASEEALTIVLLLVGSLIFALIQVHLQEIISHLDVTSDIHSNRAQRVSSFLLRERVPDGLRMRCSEYLERLWAVTRGASPRDVSRLLPDYLYATLGEAVMSTDRGLWGCFFLRSCDEHFRRRLLPHLRFELYLPGDCIFKGGEMSRRLFFLLNDERGVRLVRDGSSGEEELVYCNVLERCLGEGEFFSRSAYACSARVHAETAVLALDFADFWACLVEFSMVDHYLGLLGRGEEQLESLLTASVVRRVSKNMNHKKITKLYSSAGVGLERSRVVRPSDPLYRAWAAGSLLLALHMAISVPYYACFAPSGAGIVSALLPIDVLATAFLAVDVYLNLYVFAAVVEDKLVSSPADIYSLYLSGEFAWDVAGTLPVALLALAATGDVPLYCLLRLLQLSWLRRVRRSFRSCIDWFEALSDVTVSDGLLGVCKALLTVCYACHVAACIFAATGIAELAAGGPSWISLNGLAGEEESAIYLRALYWATYTMTTVGYGGISLASNGERILAMLVMIAGIVLCNAGVAAVLGSLISSAISLRSRARRCQEAAMKFCRSNGVGKDVQLQLADYFSYSHKQMHSTCESDDFEQLSPALRMDFVSLYAEDALGVYSFLSHAAGIHEAAKTGIVLSICRLMRTYLATPGELLLEDGSCEVLEGGLLAWRGGDLIVLRRGRVYVSEDGAEGSGRARRMELLYPGSAVAPCLGDRHTTSKSLAANFTTEDAAADREDCMLLCLMLDSCAVACDGEALRAVTAFVAVVTCGELTRRSSSCDVQTSGLGLALSGAWGGEDALLLAVPAGVSSFEISLYAQEGRDEWLVGSTHVGLGEGVSALTGSPLGAPSDAETASTSTDGESQSDLLQRRLVCSEGLAGEGTVLFSLSVYEGQGRAWSKDAALPGLEGPDEVPAPRAAVGRVVSFRAYAETYCHVLRLCAHDVWRLIAEYEGSESQHVVDRYGGIGNSQVLVRGRGRGPVVGRTSDSS